MTARWRAAIALSSGASGLTNRASTTVVEIPSAPSCSCACIATADHLADREECEIPAAVRVDDARTGIGSIGSLLSDGAGPRGKRSENGPSYAIAVANILRNSFGELGAEMVMPGMQRK